MTEKLNKMSYSPDDNPEFENRVRRMITAFDFSHSIGPLQCADEKCQQRTPAPKMSAGTWVDATGDWCYHCGSCGSTYFVELHVAEEGAPTDFGIYLKTARYALPHDGKFVPVVEGDDGAAVAVAPATHPLSESDARAKHGKLRLCRVSEIKLDSATLSDPRIVTIAEPRAWKVLHNGSQVFNYPFHAIGNAVTLY